jgi:hypothetical protein
LAGRWSGHSDGGKPWKPVRRTHPTLGVHGAPDLVLVDYDAHFKSAFGESLEDAADTVGAHAHVRAELVHAREAFASVLVGLVGEDEQQRELASIEIVRRVPLDLAVDHVAHYAAALTSSKASRRALIGAPQPRRLRLCRHPGYHGAIVTVSIQRTMAP